MPLFDGVDSGVNERGISGHSMDILHITASGYCGVQHDISLYAGLFSHGWVNRSNHFEKRTVDEC